MTVDQYVKALIDNKITVAEDVTTHPDGSKTVITDTEYSVLIEQDGERNVKITIEGTIRNLPPRITKLTLTPTINNIQVDVEARNTEGVTVQYYIKKEDDTDYPDKPAHEGNELSYTIENLKQGTIYVIKIIVSNKNGPVEKEEKAITGIQLVTSVTLNPSETTIRARDTATITAIILPDYANNKNVRWESGKPEVATVNANGVVTGVSAGTSIIKAIAEDNGKCFGTCSITVQEPLVTELTTTQKKTEHVKDKLGNPVTVPGGFKVVDGETVEDGIVIEDSIGNQFVWVPVSNIDGNGVINNQNANGLITKKDGSKVQITLGRYKFARTKNSTTGLYEDGTPTLVQKGSEYANENTGNKYTIASYYTELTTFRESNFVDNATGVNATAYNLRGFIEGVSDNHGFYIARYEASYDSGNSVTNYKPLSQKSTAKSTDKMDYVKGTLWNYIMQGNASKVCRNMYSGNDYVTSDLVNSYMWDTAIVFVQAMGYTNYANADRDTLKSWGLANTGSIGDEVCHINDMAGNLMEWTTEYCNYISSPVTFPCTARGESYKLSNMSGLYTAVRYNSRALGLGGTMCIGFRVGLSIR